MTETYSGELSEQAKRALVQLFPLIGLWRQRMESAPTQPDEGSSLIADDQAAYPYLVSEAARAHLVSAADYLDALRALLQEAQIVHAGAPFTLLRAAIENSAAGPAILDLDAFRCPMPPLDDAEDDHRPPSSMAM
jgi:hypothetical protein